MACERDVECETPDDVTVENIPWISYMAVTNGINVVVEGNIKELLIASEELETIEFSGTVKSIYLFPGVNKMIVKWPIGLKSLTIDGEPNVNIPDLEYLSIRYVGIPSDTIAGPLFIYSNIENVKIESSKFDQLKFLGKVDFVTLRHCKELKNIEFAHDPKSLHLYKCHNIEIIPIADMVNVFENHSKILKFEGFKKAKVYYCKAEYFDIGNSDPDGIIYSECGNLICLNTNNAKNTYNVSIE